MNDLIKQRVIGCHMMRNGALERLSDADLQFSTGGVNPTLGELLKEMGDLQYSYIQSLKTHQHDWTYCHDDDELAHNLDRLKSWFVDLDGELEQLVDALTETDLEKQIDRTNGVIRTIEQQLEIYNQAWLIFLGKLVVYFKAMDKKLPSSIQHYIG